MPTVLITTDFSAASRHGVDYGCMLFKDKGVKLELLHIFQIPVNYTSDGVALAGMGEGLNRAEEMMEDEVARVRMMQPGIKIEGRVLTGGFLETLKEEANIIHPMLIVLGTAGFADIYLGDNDPLNALRSFRVPVLFVPREAAIKPIRHLAYACNYAYVGAQTPIKEIRNIIQFLDASVQVVHADVNPEGYDDKQTQGQAWLDEQLSTLQPSYHWQQDNDILHGITSFVASHDIDCLMVVPRKYGIWENLFHQSKTKALARLNKVPVLAFHNKEV